MLWMNFRKATSRITRIQGKAKWGMLAALILIVGLASPATMKPIRDNSRWVSRCLIKNHGQIKYFTLRSYHMMYVYCYGFGLYDEVTIEDWIGFVKFKFEDWGF